MLGRETLTVPAAIVRARQPTTGIPLKTRVAIAFPRFRIARTFARTFLVVVGGVVVIRWVVPRQVGRAFTVGTIVPRPFRVARALGIQAADTVAGTGIGTFGKGHRGAQEEQQPAPKEPHRGSIGLSGVAIEKRATEG